jgi:hypothetical protein
MLVHEILILPFSVMVVAFCYGPFYWSCYLECRSFGFLTRNMCFYCCALCLCKYVPVTTGAMLQQGVPGLQEKQPRSDVCYKGDEEVGDGQQKHGQPR